MRTASIHPTLPSIAWPTNPVLVPKRQDKPIPQPRKANAIRSNTRNEAARPTLDGDDYGYDDVDDTEILRAVERVEQESFTDIDDVIAAQNASRLHFGTKHDKEPDGSPERLANGNYS